MKILLLEDELMLQSSILEYLDTLGHTCIAFTDGQKALLEIQKNCYDLFIFDINVPNITGLELFSKVKDDKCFTPVLFISALVDIKSISEAFDLGASDYIKKPFHLKELAIRIEKIESLNNKYQNEHIILSQNYSYSKKDNSLLYNKQIQKLTNKQCSIIQCLCANINNIMSVELLRQYVWNSDIVSDATIRTEISRLRKILKEDFIINQKGIGYKIQKYNNKL